jgi:uncharacterized delta-60 repeat protein
MLYFTCSLPSLFNKRQQRKNTVTNEPKNSSKAQKISMDQQLKLSQGVQVRPLYSGSPVAKLLAILWALSAFNLPSASAAPGDFDPAFGTNGKAIVNLGQTRHVPTGIVAQPDGKYLLSYATSSYTGGIVRFNPDHSVDNSWGFRGHAGTGNSTAGLAITSEGKVLAVENGDIAFGGSLYQRVSRYTATGELDAAFGLGGQTWPFPAGGGNFSQRFNAVAIAPDGKIIAIGESSGAVLAARYSAVGGLDTSFGIQGWARISPGSGLNEGFGVALQPDGKIVIVGNSGGNAPTGFVLRLDNAGALDTSFNSTGIYEVPHAPAQTDCRSVVLDGQRIVAGCTKNTGGVKDFLVVALTAAGGIDPNFNSVPRNVGNTNDALIGLMKHPDGRLLAVGRGGFTGDRIAVLALNADGSVNTGFASGGVYVAPEAEASEASAIGWNGSEIIVAGSRTQATTDDATILTLTASGARTSLFKTSLGFSTGNYLRVKALPSGQILSAGLTYFDNRTHYLVSRFNSNGTLDTTFGTAGHGAFSAENADVGVRDFAVQGDRKILLTGPFGAYTSPAFNVGAVRFLENGQPDNAFNANGTPGRASLAIPNTSNDGRGRSVRVQPDGKILVLGRSTSGPGYGLGPAVNLALARFNVDGSVDTSYGLNGLVSSELLGSAQYMDTDSAGRAVVAGTIYVTGATAAQTSAVRFDTLGALDATFGVGGRALFDRPADVGAASVNRVVILPDGKILVAITASNTASGLTLLHRANPDGSLDTSFGTNGLSLAVTSPGVRYLSDALDLAVLPNGTIAVVVGAISPAGVRSSAIVRFLASGQLDASFGTGGVRHYPVSEGVFLGIDAMSDGSLLLSGAYSGGGNQYGLLAKTIPENSRGATCRI